MKKGQNFNHPKKGTSVKVEPIRELEHIEAIKDLLRNNPRNQAIFTLGINTSLRPGELLGLTVGKVRGLNPDGEVILRENGSGKVRNVRLNEDCVAAINTLLKAKESRLKEKLSQNELLFTGKKCPLLVPSLNNMVKKWCAEIGLAGNFGSHSLRKTYGYQQVVTYGVGLARLAEAFNHLSEHHTLEYLCIAPEDFRGIGPKNIVEKKGPISKELQQSLLKARNEIRKLKKALKVLDEREEKFKTFFEYANDALVYMDNAGRIVEVNDVAEDIFGWSRKEVIGKRYSELGLLKPDAFENEMIKNFDDSMAGIQPTITEVEVFRKEGIRIFIEVSAKVVKKNGEIKGLMCVVRDITDRKRMEQALQESEEMARALLNATTDAVMLLDQEGCILDLNMAYADKFNRGIEETIGLCIWDLMRFNVTDLKNHLNRVIRTGRSIRFEKEYGGVWLDNIIYPVHDMQGGVSRVAVFSHDITKRKQAEEVLRQHRDHLESLVKERTVNLEQANTALKVLLKRREEDKTELEDKMLLNVKELVVPFLEQLKKSGLKSDQNALTGIIEYNLNNIISPFAKALFSRYYNFTPIEVQIANLIKQGKSTKEIADQLKVSSRTIDNHRYHIRKKLGINNERASLATHLLTLH